MEIQEKSAKEIRKEKQEFVLEGIPGQKKYYDNDIDREQEQIWYIEQQSRTDTKTSVPSLQQYLSPVQDEKLQRFAQYSNNINTNKYGYMYFCAYCGSKAQFSMKELPQDTLEKYPRYCCIRKQDTSLAVLEKVCEQRQLTKPQERRQYIYKYDIDTTTITPTSEVIECQYRYYCTNCDLPLLYRQISQRNLNQLQQQDREYILGISQNPVSPISYMIFIIQGALITDAAHCALRAAR